MKWISCVSLVRLVSYLNPAPLATILGDHMLFVFGFDDISACYSKASALAESVEIRKSEGVLLAKKGADNMF